MRTMNVKRELAPSLFKGGVDRSEKRGRPRNPESELESERSRYGSVGSVGNGQVFGEKRKHRDGTLGDTRSTKEMKAMPAILEQTRQGVQVLSSTFTTQLVKIETKLNRN